MIVSFDAEHVRRLLEVSRASEKRRPTYVQTMSPDTWRADIDPARRALLMADAAEDGLAFSAREEDVDPARIEPGLWLVGDQGIYLMSNAPIEEVKASGIEHVAYAAESNPKTMAFEDWYSAKREIFGGDDGVEFLDAAAVEQVLSQCGKTFQVDIDRDRIAFVGPEESGSPPSLS